MSTKKKADREEAEPFKNDEMRTADMFDDADSAERGLALYAWNAKPAEAPSEQKPVAE